jgi:hypothetical protein
MHLFTILHDRGMVLQGNLLKLLASVLESGVYLLGLLVQNHELVNASNFELLFLDLIEC